MSLDLYYRRVTYQEGQGGMAKEGEVKVTLTTAPPMFPGAHEVEFGEVHRGELTYPPFVRDRPSDPRRTMEAPEIIALKRWLMAIWRAAMREVAKTPNARECRKGAPL